MIQLSLAHLLVLVLSTVTFARLSPDFSFPEIKCVIGPAARWDDLTQVKIIARKFCRALDETRFFRNDEAMHCYVSPMDKNKSYRFTMVNGGPEVVLTREACMLRILYAIEHCSRGGEDTTSTNLRAG
jgi:hypothetical protein